VTIEPSGRDEFLALMRETYGSAMSEAEFDWWFDRNPAGPRVLSAAREDGDALGVLAMSFFRMRDGLAAYAVHAVTSPAARGKGVFSQLELHNEEEAAAAGARVALGFTNPMAGPILVGKLGWEDVTRLRIWARPKRLRRRGEGRLRVAAERRTFERRHEDAYRAEAASWGDHMVRDVEYLNWRYVDSPREYVRLESDRSWAVVTHAVWHGFSSAVVADAVGPEKPALLRRAPGVVEADIAVAMPNPGEERAYLAAGFVPTPRTIRFIGKRLAPDAPLPHDRRAWRFSLGDLDFF
jgi:GNAT superfamily N-acetyltransferase